MAPAHGARFPLLDGLRAVAALSIFFTHIAYESGSFIADNPLGPLAARLNVGVPIFFVLSAFLLYRPWVAARLDGAPSPRLASYARRRALRIVPAYWTALVLLGLLLPAHVPGVFGEDWWILFGFLQSYSFETLFLGLSVAWSLSTEVAFYLVLPLVALATVRALGGRERALAVRVELTVLALSAAAAFALRELPLLESWRTFGNTIGGTWPWFAAGLMLAVASVAWPEAARTRPRPLRAVAAHPGWCWAAALALLLLAAYGGILPRFAFAMTTADTRVEAALFTLIALLAVAPAALAGEAAARSAVGRVLTLPPVVWLGMVSYGIFLWHRPLILWVAEETGSTAPVVLTALAMPLALAAAGLSWYLIERPALGLARRRRTARPDRRAAPGEPATEPAP